jgi:hypothetical protein
MDGRADPEAIRQQIPARGVQRDGEAGDAQQQVVQPCQRLITGRAAATEPAMHRAV